MSLKFEKINTAELTWVEGRPYSTVYNDIYFSSENGLLESQHVFIDGNNLISRWEQLNPFDHLTFVIGETGFGSGLNFLLAWSLWVKFAPKNARLHYISCEKHPLTREDLKRCLAKWPELANYADALIESYPVLTPGYHRLEFENARVTLNLMLGDALSCYQKLLVCGDAQLEAKLQHHFVDAWFLDGFSPNINSEMWSDELLVTLSHLSKSDTTLSTFSVAGSVKRGILAAGFEVKKQQGYGKKREMLVAEWRQLPPNLLKRKTPWHAAFKKTVKRKHAIVIGAGLAGCCVASALSRRGWKVSLLERETSWAQGASGVRQAVLFPNLSAYTSPLTDFMLTTFLYAHRFYQDYLIRPEQGELLGLLELTSDKREELAKWLLSYPELGRFLNAAEASTLAGIEIHSDALFVPQSGWVDMNRLCSGLIQDPNIQLFTGVEIHSLDYELGNWHVGEHSAEVVVLANGYLANQFSQTQHLSIDPIKGQMTEIKESPFSRALRIPLCGEGHILPSQNGTHLMGATFERGVADCVCFDQDDELNFSKIRTLAADLQLPIESVFHWAGVRAGTLDHLPFVGPVANPLLFNQMFAGLAQDAKRFIGEAGAFYEGLYICSGFASRGLTTIPLSAEYLSAMINQEPAILSRSLSVAISPARYLARDLIRGVQKNI